MHLWCGQHSLTTDYVAHPDEIFEYLEPAYRLVFGQGIVTWEYAYGTRSWIISGFIALILKCLAELGLDRPDIYVPTVRLVFCAISLSLPLSVYRIAQALLDEGAARLALVGTAFWYELIFFAPTPMPDALAAYAFFAALAFLFGRAGSGAALAFGILAGLTLALRFQLAPMVGVAMLIAALALARLAGAPWLPFRRRIRGCARCLHLGTLVQFHYFQYRAERLRARQRRLRHRAGILLPARARCVLRGPRLSRRIRLGAVLT